MCLHSHWLRWLSVHVVVDYAVTMSMLSLTTLTWCKRSYWPCWHRVGVVVDYAETEYLLAKTKYFVKPILPIHMGPRWSFLIKKVSKIFQSFKNWRKKLNIVEDGMRRIEEWTEGGKECEDVQGRREGESTVWGGRVWGRRVWGGRAWGEYEEGEYEEGEYEEWEHEESMRRESMRRESIRREGLNVIKTGVWSVLVIELSQLAYIPHTNTTLTHTHTPPPTPHTPHTHTHTLGKHYPRGREHIFKP